MNMSEENIRYYFNFSFFKIDPKWRWMADLAKEESAKELENILENAPVKTRTYSTLGLRDDADFLIFIVYFLLKPSHNHVFQVLVQVMHLHFSIFFRLQIHERGLICQGN